MSFREKSAWLMSVVLLVAGAVYAVLWFEMSSAIGTAAPPLWPITVTYGIIVCVLAIGGHIVIALFAPKDAEAVYDERDRLVVAQAGHRASHVLSWGVVVSVGYYLFARNADALFYGVFISFMLTQLAEYVLQAFYYRRAI